MKKIIIAFLVLNANSICAQSWLPLGCGLNSPGYVLYPDNSSGRLFVGGIFTSLNCYQDDLIAVWNGNIWDTTFAMKGNGGTPVNTIIKYQNLIYSGGDFRYSSNIRNNGFIRWNGIGWDSLNIAFHSGGSPYSFYEYNNLLYCVGNFDSVGSYSSPLIAAWNGLNWLPIGIPHAIIGYSISSCVSFQNELYVAGHFIDSTSTIYGLAKWDGTNWFRVGSIGGFIKSLIVFNNELYMGGEFLSGVPNWSIAKYDGTNFYSVGGGINGPIRNLKVIGNKLFAVGSFDYARVNFGQVGGIPASDVAYFDGNNWYPFSNDLFGSGSTVADIAEYQNHIYVTGSFNSINGDTSFHNIAMYSSPLGEMELFKKKEEVSVYPNPASSSITIHSQLGITNYELRITDVFGRVVYKETIRANDTQVDVSRWSSGVYFYSLTQGEGAAVRGKFIKQ